MARFVRAWRSLAPERRLAAFAALGLFLTLFLPWYQLTVIAKTANAKNLQSLSGSITGWGAFSFVEAAVMLVGIGVLTLLFQRAEGKAFHLPGGDGWVIMLAGGWTCFLIIWRMFDKSGTANHGQYADQTGIEWGIFIALFVAAFLTYAGTRIRAAKQPEPPLPDGVVFDGRWHPVGEVPAPRESRRRGGSRRSERAGRASRPEPEAPVRSAAPRRERRSNWSPADSPQWSDESEHEPGWLTRRPAAEPAEPQPEPHVAPPSDDGQLTIPLEDE